MFTIVGILKPSGTPNDRAAFLVAVLNGDPAGPGPGDEQMRNMYGLNFRVKDPAFIIGEAQFRRNQGKDDTGLASTYKIGAWAISANSTTSASLPMGRCLRPRTAPARRAVPPDRPAPPDATPRPAASGAFRRGA